MKSLLTIALLSLMSASALATPYKVDVGHSAVLFKVKHFNLGYTFGFFKSFKGEFEDGKSVTLTVDADSVDSNVAKRDDHLKGPDFFNTKQFPEIAFKSTSWESVEGGATIKGQLTFHGVTKEISLKVEKVGTGNDPWGNERVGYYGELTIKRSDFGVTYGIKEGMASDELTLMISLEGARKIAKKD